MKNRWIALWGVILVGASVVVSASDARAEPIHEETRAKLLELETLVRSWAPICPGGTARVEAECPNRDTVIFTGLACLGGERERCEDVRRAQDENGRFWRDPGLIGVPMEDATFSRDQARGALAYLLATQDREAAWKWLRYIRAATRRTPFLKRRGFSIMCEDDPGTGACEIRPAFWGDFRHVWRGMGLRPTLDMTLGDAVDDITLWTSVRTANHWNDLHLAGVSIFLRQMSGHGYTAMVRSAAHTLARRVPRNPFFQYLAYGPTETAAQLVLEKCPRERPQREDLTWAWVRDEQSRPWERADGHDCIFMINLLLGRNLQQ